MAEDVTYTLVADLKTGSELGRADLSNSNAPTTEVNILQKLPSTLSINQSMEIALHVFEDLALNDKMDYSSVTGATLTGRLINSTDIAITLDASLTISGTGDYIATAIIAKDIIPTAWTAGVVRLKWELSTASNKSIIFQDQAFVDPSGTQSGTAVTGFKVTDTVTSVQPTSTIEFSTAGSVTEVITGKATVRNDVTTNISYEYDNTVAKADPGAGLFRGNNATISSVTEIYIDDLDKAGIDNGTFFSNMGTTSTLRFGAVDDPTSGELFTVTSAADETGYWTLVVVHLASGTVGMTDEATYGLTYSSAGAGGDALTANPLSQFAATTSLQLLGVMSDETGTGALAFATSPTLVTPALGTPASGVMTNVTGTAASLTVGATTGVEAGADVTDATNVAAALTLTGDVTTSAGFATTIAAKAVHVSMLDDGTDGELITWSATGVAATVAVGTSTHVLTSNGVGVAPTFQAVGGGGSTLAIYTGVVISEQVMASSGNIPDFTSIPSGYDKLELEYFAKMNSASPAEIHMGINTDLTSTNYHRQALGADNGAANNAEAANSTITYIGDNSADSFSTGVITMYDYDNTTDPKQFSTNFSVSVNTTQLSIGIRTVHWNTTSAAVSRIRLDDAISMAGNGFLIGSTFRLVGYKAVTVNIP